MLPSEERMIEWGFHSDKSYRIWAAAIPQSPISVSETQILFSITDYPWVNASRSDSRHYDEITKEEVVEQMRQMAIRIDCYSKKVPIGTALDVIRHIGSAMDSDQMYDWVVHMDGRFVIESIEYQPDLTPLLEGQSWKERQQVIVKINYRDEVRLNKQYMTRVPSSLNDLKNSIRLNSIVKR